MKTKIVSSHAVDSKPVKQEVHGKVILPPLVFPILYNTFSLNSAFCIITLITKTAYLKVDDLVQTTFRFSPASFHPPSPLPPPRIVSMSLSFTNFLESQYPVQK